jgi:hypothetical protein
MIDDFEVNRGEDDLTHLNENMELNDYNMMPFDKETFKSGAVRNLETQHIHHHILTLLSLRQLLEYAKLDIELVAERPGHIRTANRLAARSGRGDPIARAIAKPVGGQSPGPISQGRRRSAAGSARRFRVSQGGVR